MQEDDRMAEKRAANPAIQVEEVSRSFGQVKALDRVSFSVNAGELFFLLGPSGCGKTTMLRILAGLETSDSGRVLFNGKDIAVLPPHRRGAPMVFQNYALWPHMTVHDNVAFGLVERKIGAKEIEDRVNNTLRQVGLEGLGKRTPGQLSGGQQQRVVLARALVLNPGIMLLDEPLSNLDAKLRAGMRAEIEALHAETDISFVYVTHDQVEALSLADRLAVLRDGRVLAVGTPAELYHRPPNVFCADFLGEANLLQGTVKGHEGDYLLVDTAFGTWRGFCPVSPLPPEGESVRCLVRPENLCPGGDDPRSNRLTAVIRSVRLHGATLGVSLSAGTEELKATLLNRYAVDLVPGNDRQWEAAPDDTVIIVED